MSFTDKQAIVTPLNKDHCATSHWSKQSILQNQSLNILAHFYQKLQKTAKIEIGFLVTKIVPVIKKKDRSSPTNYRPVSLTSICYKVLEHIIYSNISLHLKNHNILCGEQHGFRTKRSCKTQLISTIHELAKNIHAGIQTDAILLDLTKAFDRVPHMRLCNKLSYFGINDDTLKWIKNFLHGRTQQVTVEGYHSSPINVTSRVSQGTVLAPLLFLCYINDLPANINCSIKYVYADDVLIYRPIRLPDHIKSLQEGLNTIEQWALHWQARFNPVKCEHIRITNIKNVYFLVLEGIIEYLDYSLEMEIFECFQANRIFVCYFKASHLCTVAVF